MIDLMALNGTLISIWHLKTTGAMRIEIEVDKSMANEAFRRIGGFPDPASPRMVAIAVINPVTDAQAVEASELDIPQFLKR